MAKYSNIDLSKYSSGFKASDEVSLAKKKKEEAESAVSNYGDFTYKNQEAYDKVLDAILNREKFSYDLNADALYQQYKDAYINQGRMAMMDTMGQAAALTGGYGNSYAATAGNQAYQGYLQRLNDVVPELYRLALDRYTREGADLTNRFGVLQSDRGAALDEYNAALNRLMAERDYYNTDYNAAYNRDFTAWNANRDYDTQQYWNEEKFGYQKEQDAIANKLARDQLQAQINANKQAQTIKELQAQINNLNEEKKNLVKPDVAAAANSERVKSFQRTIMSPKELARRGYTTTVGGTKRIFDNYQQYIDAVIENEYKQNRLTQNEVAWLVSYYNLG